MSEHWVAVFHCCLAQFQLGCKLRFQTILQLTDLLSRGREWEWRLHPLMVAQIWDHFGRVEVDLFASRANTHCSMFFSITDRNVPLGMDVLAHTWPNTPLYAFPLVEMILSVLEGVR